MGVAAGGKGTHDYTKGKGEDGLRIKHVIGEPADDQRMVSFCSKVQKGGESCRGKVVSKRCRQLQG